MTEVNATALPCEGNYFLVSVNITAMNTSPGFTLAGNGVIYGTFLYDDLPVVVGPLLGDDESVYEFIAWDVEEPACQQFTTIIASNCGPICGFSNATLDSLGCNPSNNNYALVELDFDHEGTTNPAFDVFYENGTEAGSFLYASLPVTILNFAVNGSEPIVLTICDNNNPDCCETFQFDAIDCNPNNCEIFNVTLDPQCTGNNFVVHLDFDYTNVASDSFTVTGNNLNYGKFGYNELPLTLGPLNGGTNLVWQYVIRDSEVPACQKVAVLGMYTCPPPCDVLALEANAFLCNGNEAYQLAVSLDIEGEGDNGFSVFSETAYYGTFEYDDLPITIPYFEGSGDLVDFVTVCDNDNNGCCATIAYEALLCSGCLIYNLHATPIPCNELDQIYVSLDFDFQNVSGDGYSVAGNGTFYGNFTYDSVPVLIGPFPGDGSQFLEFVVTDLVNGDCFDATEIGLLACGDICELSNLVVETGDCSGNNTYLATVDFDFENVTGVGFDLFVNGEFYEFYNYNDLPLTIEEFPSSGNIFDTITVCENDNPDCCTTLVFEAPDCECQIFDANLVENIGCTSDSTFGVVLEFFYENLPGDFVDVFFDGVFIGFYSVNDIPLLIPNIPEGDGTGILSVCANDLNSCCDEIAVELMNCEGGGCNIFELFAEAGDCNSDSTFLLDVFFNHINLPTDSVLIYGNNELIGQYVIDSQFIRIENFPVLGNITQLLVCAVGAPDCCEDYSFETPDCDTTNCDIWDLIAVPGDCQTDSTYTLVIEYNSQNVPGDFVTVTVNGIFIGTFEDPDEHIIIEDFPWFDGDVAVLTLCSFEFPDCCDTYEFEIPNCPGPNACSIFDLVVNFEGCQTDSTYLVAINFEYNNLPGTLVTVTANDQTIGSFPVNEGHIIVENFPVLPTANTVVTVCAFGTPDCCSVYEFVTPDCEGGGECQISGLEVNFEGCQSDSTYTLVVNFENNNLPVDSVIITANEEFIGQFQLQEGHIIIQNFPVVQSEITVLTVCAVADPNCCDVLEFTTPVCDDSCHVVNMFAEVGSCTSDSTFILDIVFDAFNLPVDSVTVHVGDLLIGQFFNHPDFIHIDTFPLFDGATTTITVCAAGDTECCDTYTFENPTCDGECDIFEVNVDVQECTTDSTFGVFINFQHVNISAGGFDIYAGVNYLGFFGLDQIPILIPNFPANGEGQYVVTICESDNLECCESYEFDGPVCDDFCEITNLEWSITECDSAGNFFFILNFDFQNVGNEGFNVVGNGNNYGNFSYENLPIQIGPFESGNTVFEFLVTDGQNSACFDFVEPGMVDCIVATEEISYDNIFEILDNGSSPSILPLENLSLSLFNSNGKTMLRNEFLQEGNLFELNNLPSGVYIGTVIYAGNIWSVKLVKSSY